MRRSDLTPEQLECVEFDRHQHLLIKGPPGSGKTWVLLFRARHLSPQRPHAAQFVTFTNALMKYADELNKVITAETAPAVSPETETETETLQGAQTCHQWCWRLMGRMGPWRPAGGPSYRYKGLQRPVIDDKRRKAAILQAIGRVRERAGRISTKVLDNPFEWWLDEFRWIKGALLSEEAILPEGIVLPKGRLIKTFADYKGAARTGRGSALQAGPRQLVWDVFSAYQEFLKTAHTVTRDTRPPHPSDEIDFDDYARRIVEYCCAASGVTSCLEMSIPRECEESRMDHVLIDESQDLTQVQLLLLSKLARKTVTLVADMSQKIYKSPFTYESAGLSIGRVNGNIKTLSLGFRSTRQICALADPLREMDERMARTESQPEGPTPALHVAASPEDEEEVLVRLVSDEVRRNPGNTVAVLARSWEEVQHVSVLLSGQGLRPDIIERKGGSATTAGVKLTTYHSAKGLEFDTAILIHVTDGVMPLLPREYHGDMEAEDEEEFLASERRLLYVAMTRARRMLHMTCMERRSRFLRAPYATAYETVETVAEATPAVVAAEAPEAEEMISLDDFDDIPF